MNEKKPQDFPALLIRNATLKLEGNTILHDFNWQVERGERWFVLGPNGAGKTSLVKMILGMVWPLYGAEVRVLGNRYGFCDISEVRNARSDNLAVGLADKRPFHTRRDDLVRREEVACPEDVDEIEDGTAFLEAEETPGLKLENVVRPGTFLDRDRPEDPCGGDVLRKHLARFGERAVRHPVKSVWGPVIGSVR